MCIPSIEFNISKVVHTYDSNLFTSRTCAHLLPIFYKLQIGRISGQSIILTFNFQLSAFGFEIIEMLLPFYTDILYQSNNCSVRRGSVATVHLLLILFSNFQQTLPMVYDWPLLISFVVWWATTTLYLSTILISKLKKIDRNRDFSI